MKITIYSTNDCQFSKQEKDYLKAHNLPFEEKNLESNREFLTEMLTLSNNFAGTPVTKIEKDDGNVVILKGFTTSDFDTNLEIVAEPSPTQAVANSTLPVPESVVSTPPLTTPEPLPPTPPPTPEPTPEPVSQSLPPLEPAPVMPPEPPVTPVIPVTPPNQTETNNALDGILNTLQTQSQPSQPTNEPPASPSQDKLSPTPTSPQSSAPTPPTVPDFKPS
jgi:glutaredoxin